MSDLIIKIGADAKDVKKAFDDVKKQTEDLEGGLDSLAKISGVAFAALTAQVALSVKTFAESENASIQLSATLQNQGIYTDALKQSYQAYAEEVSKSTGISKVQLTQAQTIAQQFLGQIPITKELTKAIADYSVKTGSTAVAAEDIAKAIGNGTGALIRQGLQFQATDTEQQRFAKTLAFINTKYADYATAVDPVTLATRKLGTAFEENQAALGARFAPAMAAAINAVTNFIAPSKEANSIALDLKASFIVLGSVVAGLGVGLPLAVNGFIAFRAALIALNVQLSVTQALLAGLGIGLLSIAVTELVLHFKQLVAVASAVVTSFKQLETAALGVLKILAGLSPIGIATGQTFKLVKGGVDDLKASFAKLAPAVKDAWEGVNKETEKGATQQDAAKRKAALAEHALQKEKQNFLIAASKEESQLLKLEAEHGSQALIEIKKQEIETLKALERGGTEEQVQALRDRYARLKAEEVRQRQEDGERQKEFLELDKAARKKYGNEKVEMTSEQNQKEIEAIKRDTDTKETAQKKVYLDELKAQQKAHNQFLQEQIKYGTAFAVINRAIQSEEVQGVKKATGELVDMQNSKNATLKQIGKAAAVAQITIKTAESAMNIYEGFSTIPIIGPALGIAAAAAAIAYGAEQIGDVTAAATGGVVGGIGYGDTQPFMLEPGELIAPKQNFNEVIDSVAKSRGYSSPNEDNGGAGYAEVRLTLDDNLMDFIEAKLVQRKYLNISLQGAR